MNLTFAARLARIGGGFLLLVAGAAMLVLPGPGWLSIGVGLALLATEYVWARRWLNKLKKTARDAKLRVSGPSGRVSP